MVEKIVDIIKSGNMNIPSLLFFRYRDLKINLEELHMLIYLINLKDKNYNPKQIAEDLNYELVAVMEEVDNLVSKGFVKINVVTVGKMHHEYIELDSLYQQLAFLVVNDTKETMKKDDGIFDVFEKEFGRTLSPIEYELISVWQEGHYSKEIIIAALKEAVYNGVTNIRYVDRILNDWHKKGIKNLEDVQKEKENFRNQKSSSKPIFEYDWLNDTSEEN